MKEVSLGAREEILEVLSPRGGGGGLRRMDCGTFANGGRGLGGGLAPAGGSSAFGIAAAGREMRWPLTAMGPGSTGRSF